MSTDHLDIVDVVQSLGLSVDFLRPSSLSDDYTLYLTLYCMSTTTLNLLVFLDSVTLIYPTSVTLTSEDLLKSHQKTNLQPVLSVTSLPVPLQKVFYVTEPDLFLKQYLPTQFNARSQDLPSYFSDAAMFAIYPSTFLDTYTGNSPSFYPYFIDPHRVIDIDTPEDWIRAELLYKSLYLS